MPMFTRLNGSTISLGQKAIDEVYDFVEKNPGHTGTEISDATLVAESRVCAILECAPEMLPLIQNGNVAVSIKGKLPAWTTLPGVTYTRKKSSLSRALVQVGINLNDGNLRSDHADTATLLGRAVRSSRLSPRKRLGLGEQISDRVGNVYRQFDSNMTESRELREEVRTLVSLVRQNQALTGPKKSGTAGEE